MTEGEKHVITSADVGVLEVGASTAPKAKVGDFIMLRGRSRQIDRIDEAKNEVHFTNPATEPAPPSLAGTCALNELKPMVTPLGVIWYQAKTLEPKEVREGAIQLQPAVADIGAGEIELALRAQAGGGSG